MFPMNNRMTQALYKKSGISTIVFLVAVLSFTSCAHSQNKENKMNANHKYTNELINESSPYLLQHAHNPVNWHAWNEKTLQLAKDEDKPLLISIGYSACHWCHVMEHESFEDDEVARLMNGNFICIKVDREERPDVDDIYMNAVQIVSGSGGWPLNCFALPDGRPFWGGTYFPKQKWKSLLTQITEMYKSRRDDLEKQAESITHSVNNDNLFSALEDKQEFTVKDAKKLYHGMRSSFDLIEGGTTGSPKFPMPSRYEFLLNYYYNTNDKSVLDYVELSLRKMAFGGIYDQLGGGFARYSVDGKWKVPHFEKMLYDNAQLVSVYSHAYQLTGSELFKSVISETLEYVQREMTSQEGAFYSSLDADSNGEEGEFYVWSSQELKEVLRDDASLFIEYYHIDKEALWEGDNNVLLRAKTLQEFAAMKKLDAGELETSFAQMKYKLMQFRETRVRPTLDDKILTSWNALMLKAYVDAYMVLGEQKYLDAAIENAEFISSILMDENGKLCHSFKDGKKTANGFLEDYSLTINAFIQLYQSAFDEKWLNLSRQLFNYSLQHFYNKKSGIFYFTSDVDPGLIARKVDLYDQVIPSSLSVMARAANDLGWYFDENSYREISRKLLSGILPKMLQYPNSFTNWGSLFVELSYGKYMVAIAGKEAVKKALEINKTYLPNKLLIGSSESNDHPHLVNRYVQGETRIYVCTETACKAFTTDAGKAVELIRPEK
jgi:uncharacterized protein YyaL (SSP411 family)